MKPVKPGDTAPDFTLPTPWGIDVALRDSLLKEAVVLEFLRGTWDPNSRERLEALAGYRDELEALRTRILVISCERVTTARAYLEAHPSPLSFLVDESRETARAYGVLQRFSYGAFNVARPATFVIDRCAFVRYAHVGRSPIQSAPFEGVSAALAEIEKEARDA